MKQPEYRNEIRDSVIRNLLEKVRKQNYAGYLLSLRLEKIRMFNGAQITFDFPVTALIGPNGGGKSTILSIAACAYDSNPPEKFFQFSPIGDERVINWDIEYEIVEKQKNPRGTLKFHLNFQKNKWHKETSLKRTTKFFGINRTLPPRESSVFPLRRKLSISYKGKQNLQVHTLENTEPIKKEAEKILGKSLDKFEIVQVISQTRKKKHRVEVKTQMIDGEKYIRFEHVETGDVKVGGASQTLIIGSDGKTRYSEFNFGSGESAIIRMVAEMEVLTDGALILIDEIENGLHPLAVRRMVEYLIDVAERKNFQVIFTTHSDHAIAPLPSEAIWACLDGKLQQGRLSVEALRAVSGRIDKRLAVFVEDDFAKTWVEAILREKLSEHIDEVGVYAVSGDGNATKVHSGHMINPSIQFRSICLIDGDSQQIENWDAKIYRLPGKMPEATIFNSVLANLDTNIALLTVACQRGLDKQKMVSESIKNVSYTNRDPHLLFSQVGAKIGFIPERTVAGAFITVWINENSSDAEAIAGYIKQALIY